MMVFVSFRVFMSIFWVVLMVASSEPMKKAVAAMEDIREREAMANVIQIFEIRDWSFSRSGRQTVLK